MCKYFILLTIFFFVSTSNVFAYSEITTHPALTQEIVDFYNSVASIPLTPEQKEWIIQGSILEDATPRWLNHFYDPVYNTGWSGDHTGNISPDVVRFFAAAGLSPSGVVSAPEWIHAVALQQDYERYGGNRTWERALEYFASGNEKEAYITLGYALHLLEDMSVPDHTRNDTHAHPLEGITGDPGSPYELYTETITRQTIKDLKILESLKKDKVGPVGKSSIEEYLISLAEYSNKYFFSKDTINISKYSNPKIIREDNEFGYGLDETSTRFPLVRVKSFNINGDFQKIYSLDVVEDTLILDAYFVRLARQTILHGAGVIQLFHTQGAEAKELAQYPTHAVKYDFSFLNVPMLSVGSEGLNLWNSVASIAGAVGNGIKDGTVWVYDHSIGAIVGWFSSDDGFENVSTIPLGGDAPVGAQEELSASLLNTFTTPRVSAPSVDSRPPDLSAPRVVVAPRVSPSSSIVLKPKSPKEEEEDVLVVPEKPTVLTFSPKECSFATAGSPTRNVVLNEIAWMGSASSPQVGTTGSANDEWIELRNMSSAAINLSGWHLMDQGEDIDVVFEEGLIPAGGFFLLERTDDASVPSVAADAIYVGALSNTNEGVRLFDAECNVIDEVFASSSWPAGDSPSRSTMERRADFSWQTSSVAGGTPRLANSQGQVASSQERMANSKEHIASGTGAFVGSPTPDVPKSDVAASSTRPTTSSDPTTILISEIQTGMAGEANYEFIELYNFGDATVDLAGWDLKKKTSSGSVSNLATNMTGSIPAHGFFLVGSRVFASSSAVLPDFVYTQGSNHLAYENNSVVLFDATDVLRDEVTYGEIPADTSLERKSAVNSACGSAQGGGEFLGNGCDTDALLDWDVRTTPLPQTTRSLHEPRSAALHTLATQFSSDTMELFFDWTPSASSGQVTSASSGQVSFATSSLQYALYEASTSAPLFQGTSSTARVSILEVGRDYVFSLYGEDEEGFAMEVASSTISVPSFLSSLTLYQDPRSGTSSPEYFVDMKYDAYPFLPADLVAEQHEGVNYKAIALFLNQEAPTSTFLDSPQFPPREFIPFSYLTCNQSVRTASYLILPDNASSCDIFIGGFTNNAMHYPTYFGEGDLHLNMRVAPSRALTHDDYITVGYYGFYRFYPPFSTPGPDGLPNFKLIAVDRIHYPLRDSLPTNTPPVFNSFDVLFDESQSRVTLLLPVLTDPDTLDKVLQYEVQFSTDGTFLDGEWETLTRETTLYHRSVSPGDRFTIGVRAKDDFGNISAPVIQEWEYPAEQVPIVE